MYRIVISGPVRVQEVETSQEVTDPEHLARFDSLPFGDESVLDYLGHEELSELPLEGGRLRLSFHREASRLEIQTEFQTDRRLTKKLLALLEKETIGQWSDGIGAGPGPDLEEELGVSLDLLPDVSRGAVKVSQEKVAGPARKAPKRIYGAIRRGDLAKVRAAIEAGEDLAELKQGMPPLGWAIHHAQPEVVALLVEAGADVNQVYQDGDSPLLHCALISGQSEKVSRAIAETLLAGGADACYCSTAKGLNCLAVAMDRRKPGLVELLREHGALAFDAVIEVKVGKGAPSPKHLGCAREDWATGHYQAFASAGRFSFPGLAPGRYLLCAAPKVDFVPAGFSVSETGEVEPRVVEIVSKKG